MPYVSIAKPTGANYTRIAKPGGVTIRAGMKNMLMMPLTFSRPRITGDSVNIRVSIPTVTPYTNVAKPVAT